MINNVQGALTIKKIPMETDLKIKTIQGAHKQNQVGWRNIVYVSTK